jgi:hypothetical protein
VIGSTTPSLHSQVASAKGPFHFHMSAKPFIPIAQAGRWTSQLCTLWITKSRIHSLEGGFTPNDIAVAYPEDLDKFIGPETKVVGISSMDPTGMGYVSKTYSSIVGGGEPMNRIEFRKLVMHPAIKKYKDTSKSS